MQPWHLLPRGIRRAFTAALLIGALLALVTPALHPAAPAAAQDDPDALIEGLALAVHRQNLRLNSYTAWIGGSLGDPGNAPQRTVVGDTLSNVTLTGFAGDPDIDLESRERPVLLNFWASWCPPCRAEFPHLAQVALHPDDYAFDVIFVNMSDTERDAREFLAEYPQELTTTLDENDRFALRASVASIPTSLLLDSDGTVLLAHIGTVTPTVSAFIDAVAAYPGAGVFVSADHMDEPTGAILAPVDIDDALPLTPGEAVQGALDDAQFQQAYRFEGRAGDVTAITMETTGGDLDPYLVLMTASGERLDENDDIQEGVITDSTLSVTLPDDGVYLVIATRFLEAEGFSNGRYTLTMTIDDGTVDADDTITVDDNNPLVDSGGETQRDDEDAAFSGSAPDLGVTPQQGESLTLSYGQSGSATISDTEYEQRWTFEGATDDVITIEMARTVDQAGELDGYLILAGPDGTTLLEVDDANNTVMPTIENYTLPESGTYTIVATRFGFASGFSTGEYTLSLRAGDSVTPSPVRGTDWLPNDDLPDDLRLINYNETVVGTIGDSNSDDWYTFQGNQGDVISVTMFPEDVVAGGTWLDPFLILTTASGVELALNDDQGSGVDAAISDFILPTTDTYLIRATRYGFENGPSSGSYTLTITAFTTSPVTTSVIALDYGDTASGNLSFDSPIDRYTFEGHAGEQVTIRIAGGQDLQPVLVLRKPDGNTLGSDINPAGAPEAVLLRVPLPADGTYTVEVIPKDLNTGGDYVLLLLGHDIPAINPGAFEPAPGVDLEVVLIWSSGADLDLLYSAPENAADPHRNAANDLCQNMTPTPVERLAWDTGSAEPGSYAITVAYRSNCDAQQDPVAFILAIARNGDVIDLIGGTLAREGDLYTTRATYDR